MTARLKPFPKPSLALSNDKARAFVYKELWLESLLKLYTWPVVSAYSLLYTFTCFIYNIFYATVLFRHQILYSIFTNIKFITNVFILYFNRIVYIIRIVANIVLMKPIPYCSPSTEYMHIRFGWFYVLNSWHRRILGNIVFEKMFNIHYLRW